MDGAQSIGIGGVIDPIEGNPWPACGKAPISQVKAEIEVILNKGGMNVGKTSSIGHRF